jgi:hypothetical protein
MAIIIAVQLERNTIPPPVPSNAMFPMLPMELDS